MKEALARQAAVVLLGPRQVGKTTLAQELGKEESSIYLDLEWPEDRQKLENPGLFFGKHEDKLVILDEIHRVPEIFQPLRTIIDQGRRKNKGTGRFLLLGSASLELLNQSGESLAGRVEYIDLPPLNCLEIKEDENELNQLWLRGGFPDSFLAKNEKNSLAYRMSFIRTYLEREIPQFGSRIASQTLERFWTMLAHSQGSIINASQLSRSLMLSAKSVTSYVDLFTDLLLVRKIPPYFANIKKRMVKSPKVYIRDSGLLHGLLGIRDFENLLGHPIIGNSWEGFVLENLINCSPVGTKSSFYRTSGGAEVDLVLELPGKQAPWVFEVKHGTMGKLNKGFYYAVEDIAPEKSFVVHKGKDSFPIDQQTEALSLFDACKMLEQLSE
ncbi:MAG: ATP-binding protein [Opitutales bacterium]